MDPNQRGKKNSERLEIRLPLDLKSRFLTACKRAGDTPSQVIRTALEAYSSTIEAAEQKQLRQDLKMKLVNNPLKAVAMFGAAITGAILLVSAPSAADEDLFDALDSNKDGELTEVDTLAQTKYLLQALDEDQSQSISKDEFRSRYSYAHVQLSKKLRDIAEFHEDGNFMLPSDSLQYTDMTLVKIDMSQPGKIFIEKEKIVLGPGVEVVAHKFIYEDPDAETYLIGE